MIVTATKKIKVARSLKMNLWFYCHWWAANSGEVLASISIGSALMHSNHCSGFCCCCFSSYPWWPTCHLIMLISTNTSTVPSSLMQDVKVPLPVYQVTPCIFVRFVDHQSSSWSSCVYSRSLMSHIHPTLTVISFILLSEAYWFFKKGHMFALLKV